MNEWVTRPSSSQWASSHHITSHPIPSAWGNTTSDPMHNARRLLNDIAISVVSPRGPMSRNGRCCFALLVGDLTVFLFSPPCLVFVPRNCCCPIQDKLHPVGSVSVTSQAHFYFSPNFFFLRGHSTVQPTT